MTRLRRRCRGEGGSVALAIMVMVVLAGLTTVMLARDVSEVRLSRGAQNRAAALSATDAALATTSARIAIETSGFSTNGTAGAATWTSTAVKVSSTEWTVHVVGTASGTSRMVDTSFVQRNGSGWVVSKWREVGI